MLLQSCCSGGCLLVLLLAGICLADFNFEICQNVKSSCGLVPPRLPSSFVMKGAKVDIQNKRNFNWFEEYFDPDNLRGKYVEIADGQENHYIFDYLNNQVVNYVVLHPGAKSEKNPTSEFTCFARDMDDSPIAGLLGLKFGRYDSLRPRMYNAYESLRYGGPYAYAFNGSAVDRERGLDGSVFRGCVYDENADATYDMTFEWTGEKVSPAFGGALSVPLRIEENGGFYTKKQDQERVWNPVHTIKSVSWFETNPYMKPELFQPPSRMSCESRRTEDPSARPIVPNYFSARMETFNNVQDWKGTRVIIQKDSYQEVWYDSGAQLVRHDHLPSLLEELELNLLDTFDKVAMVTAVYDFNNGISFFTDKVQGLCVAMPIPISKSSFFLSKKSTPGNAILGSAQEVLGIDETLQYKGRYVVRGMDCKGYTGPVNTTVPKGDPVPILREVFFTTDGWHQDLDGEEDFAWPVRDVQIYSTLYEEKTAHESAETNYYKFKTAVPSYKVYDISGCAINMKKRFFQMTFSGGTSEFVQQWYSLVLQQLQGALANRANLGSPLRVQDAEVFFSDDGRMIFSFNILDVFEVKGDVTSPAKGLPLDEAVEGLRRDINIGLFAVPILTSVPDQEKVQLEAVPNSLQEMVKTTQAGRVVDSAPPAAPTLTSLGFLATLGPFYAADQQDDKAQKVKGYTKGALAGLGVAMLIVGLVVGVAAMLFYFNKFQGRRDTETADFVLNASSSH